MRAPLIAALLGTLVTVAPLAVQSAAGEPSFDAVRLPVDESAVDAAYASALALIDASRHTDALAALRRVQAAYPAFSRLSAVQTRIAVLQEAGDAGDALSIFLDALDARDVGRLDLALAALDGLVERHPANPLLDDALYLGAYLSVMDGYDFVDARERLDRLETRFPDSAYADSALYLSGIVHEQLGDTARARQALVELRERHTALGLPFGYRWPKGTLLSRYWFDRAERRIDIIDSRLRSATRVGDTRRLDDGRLRVAVDVDGIDMQLLLEPSRLVARTAWRDAWSADRAPPDIGVYEGMVEGNAGSWVRATISAGSITGMIGLPGSGRDQETRLRLLPEHLIGTLDYYQPATRGASFDVATAGDPGLAAHLQAIDLLIAPPRDEPAARRSRDSFSATREVPLSIVVDSRFDGYHAGRGLARALDYLNVADGVYRTHGLSIALDEAVVLDEGADPLKLAPGTLESMLRQFRDYRLSRASLFEDSAATYLFTGNRKTDATLGLAWIDTLCRTDGYDVGITTPSSFGDVLLTHELGHSFGAQHDSDTACSDDSAALMWPHISERTGTRLTSCSRSSVQASRARACLANTVDLHLSAALAADRVSFTISHAEPLLSVASRLVIEAGWPGQVIWPADCRVLTPTSADCPVDAIGPGEQRTVSLALASDTHNGAHVDVPLGARVTPIGPSELHPADNVATTLTGAAPVPVQTGDDADALILASAPARNDEPGEPASGAGGGTAGWWGLVTLGAMVIRRRRTKPGCTSLPPVQRRGSASKPVVKAGRDRQFVTIATHAEPDLALWRSGRDRQQ